MAISVGSGRCGRQSLPSLNGYYGKNCHSCQTVGVHRLQCTECERTETFLIRMVGSHLEVRTKNQMLEDFYSEHVLNFLCIIFERRDKKYYSEITTFWFLYSLQQLNTCAEMTTVFSCVCVRARARACVFWQRSSVEVDTKFVDGLHVPTRGTGGAGLPSWQNCNSDIHINMYYFLSLLLQFIHTFITYKRHICVILLSYIHSNLFSANTFRHNLIRTTLIGHSLYCSVLITVFGQPTFLIPVLEQQS